MNYYLGVELGSTRIKSVLIDGNAKVMAIGSHTWEDKLENCLWTYSESEIKAGLANSVNDLKKHRELPKLSGLGVSAMMHGYIALDADGNLLVPFRTWRNTNTGEAADALSSLFDFNIPMRWSIAHLYQSILNQEEHVGKIAYLTTLSGYIHYKLTGEKVLGVGDASGMFPIDSATCDYDQRMLDQFDELIKEKNYPWKIRDILPRVLPAGANAGFLTDDGAKYLNAGIEAGTPLCPPEGDAGTGMVATNSIKPLTGNISAGTSLFAMLVLDKPLKRRHPEIDVVTTPDGLPVAMVHCNNCTSDLNAWVGLFGEFARLTGNELQVTQLMDVLFKVSADGDCSDLMNYNYLSGEPVTGFIAGRPVFLREAGAGMTLAGFMKTQIYSSLASLAIGMRVLHDEDISVKEICGHGGFFKTEKIGQLAMSAAINAPVTVMENAGEGGAWGIAVLAAYADNKCPFPEYLDRVFHDCGKQTLCADDNQICEFNDFLERYEKNLVVEKAAVSPM